MNFSERRKQLNQHFRYAEDRRKVEAYQRARSETGSGWGWEDSPLVDDGNELEEPIERRFSGVIPATEGGMKRYIEDRLARRKGQALGLELGGLGYRLFNDLGPNFFGQTAAVALTAGPPSRPDLMDPEVFKRHIVIPGDVLRWETKKQIKDWRGDRQIDLIVQRMLGGLSDMPANSEFLIKEFKDWYSALAEGGVIFTQLPEQFVKVVGQNHRDAVMFRKWINLIERDYKNLIELKVDMVKAAMRLAKNPGAPDQLPVIV